MAAISRTIHPPIKSSKTSFTQHQFSGLKTLFFYEHELGMKSCSREQTTLCPQQCMNQQSAWLLNHISTHPIKQWSTELGPKSRHKAHSRAIESIWLHLHSYITLLMVQNRDDYRNAQCGIHQLITFLSLRFRPGPHADVQNLLILLIRDRCQISPTLTLKVSSV